MRIRSVRARPASRLATPIGRDRLAPSGVVMVRAMPRRSPRLAVALVALVTIATVVTIGPTPLTNREPVAEAAPAEKRIPTPGPLGPITVIGDSVLLGSLLTSPTLADTLAAR